MSLSPGAIVDQKYRIESLIGQGAFGSVYRASHLQLGKIVALKMLSARVAIFDPEQLFRLQREAQALSKIHHPGIVSVYSCGVWESFPYICIELAEGTNLEKEINAGCLTMEQSLSVISQCSAALAHAHACGVVHRDLKPNNIIVSHHEDNSPSVKIIDLGLAKLLPVFGVDHQQLTKTGFTVGTLSYMSPEQCKGSDIDSRSDIYAMGAILHHCLTGRAPFGIACADNVAAEAMLVQHLLAAPPLMSEVFEPAKNFPPDLQGIVFKAMAKNAAERYQTADAMQRDIDALRTGKHLGLPTKYAGLSHEDLAARKNLAPIIRWTALSAITICASLALLLVYLNIFGHQAGWMSVFQRNHNAQSAQLSLPVAEQERRLQQCIDEERSEEGLKYANALVSEKPGLESYFNRAVCLQKLGRLEEAVVDLDKAIGLAHWTRTADVSAVYVLFDIDVLLDRWQQAQQLCDRMKREGLPQYQLQAKIYTHFGKYRQALEQFKLSRALIPSTELIECFEHINGSANFHKTAEDTVRFLESISTDTVPSQINKARVCSKLADLANIRDDFDDALVFAMAAKKVFLEYPHSFGAEETNSQWRFYCQALALNCKYDEALTVLSGTMDTMRTQVLKDPPNGLYSRLLDDDCILYATIAYQCGHWAEAEHVLLEEIKRLRGLGAGANGQWNGAEALLIEGYRQSEQVAKFQIAVRAFIDSPEAESSALKVQPWQVFRVAQSMMLLNLDDDAEHLLQNYIKSAETRTVVPDAELRILHELLANLYLRQGRREKEAHYIADWMAHERSTEDWSDLANAYYYRGRLAQDEFDCKSAAADYKAAQQLLAQHATTQETWVRICRMLESLAIVVYQTEGLQGEYNYFQQAIDLDIKHNINSVWHDYLGAARSALAMHRNEEGLQLLKRALQSVPSDGNSTDCKLEITAAYREYGRVTEARNILRSLKIAPARNAQQVRKLVALADLDSMDGNYKNAEILLQEVRKQAPGISESNVARQWTETANWTLAYVQAELHEEKAAEASFNIGPLTGRTSAFDFHRRVSHAAFIRQYAHNPTEALSELHQLLQSSGKTATEPELLAARTVEAAILWESGMYEQCSTSCQNTLAILNRKFGTISEPQSALVNLYLCRCQLASGNYSTAEKLALESQGILEHFGLRDSDCSYQTFVYASSILLAAESELKLGKLEEARFRFERVLAMLLQDRGAHSAEFRHYLQDYAVWLQQTHDTARATAVSADIRKIRWREDYEVRWVNILTGVPAN